jgi:hypothetical protein
MISFRRRRRLVKKLTGHAQMFVVSENIVTGFLQSHLLVQNILDKNSVAFLLLASLV